MSEDNVVTAPPVKKSSKPRQSRDAFTIQDMARARLLKRKATVTEKRLYDECKTVRGIIRANKSDLGKKDAAVRTHEKNAPWGKVNASTFKFVVSGK